MRYLNRKAASIKEPPAGEIILEPVSANIQDNIDRLSSLLNDCSDAVIKEFIFGLQKNIKCLLIYFDGLADRKEIEENLLRPMLLELNMFDYSGPDKSGNLLVEIQQRILAIAELEQVSNLQDICHRLCLGDTVLLIDGSTQALVAGTRFWESRAIESPENESVIQGPKDGFTETINTNISLLRRRLKTTQFKAKNMVIGRITKTDVIIFYIASVASEGLVEEVLRRLSLIDIDGILDPGYLEEFIEDTRLTIFGQVEYTEKPDRVVGHLLEGRVCILVDGSPMAMVIPTSFPQFLIAGEDYYQRYIPASLFRLIRFAAFLIALTLPSIYVATITYHHEIIPFPLYLTIASSRAGVPFPAIVEALALELTFELLREAGLRLPRAIGPAVSIVGALIIGDAAVKAGLVSTPMVVIVAFTGIASFVTPAYNAGIIIRIARFGILIAASLLGFYGIIVALTLMLIRMVSLESFGEPYLSPLSPLNTYGLSDIFIRRTWPSNWWRSKVSDMHNRLRLNTQKGDD